MSSGRKRRVELTGGHSLTPLSYFLQTSMLSTDTEGDKDDKETPVSSATAWEPLRD